MSQECTHDCSSCSSDCASRETQQTDFRAKPHQLSNIKKIIGVVSGKGGVGKSIVTSMLAVLANRSGLKAAILDADITGPSIPKAFGIKTKATGSEMGILPVSSKTGIEIMSVNLLLEDETDPVVWRGPVIAGTVKQFYTDVIWNDIDVMFIDMPPGTGDVPLTVFQSLPIDGIVIVASPQQLVGMIVEKAVKMAELMNIPVIGLVENMSYVVCPDCKKPYHVFGESRIDEIAKKFGVNSVAKLPIDPKLAAACDAGLIELFSGDWLNGIYETIVEL
ncbi:MAG: P-loop NTPase [Clostridia bacterium]|nr:P-loop NTPase [Clostridia bacterium]